MALAGRRMTRDTSAAARETRGLRPEGTTQSVRRLLKALRNRDEDTRTAGAEALGRTGNLNVVPALIDSLHDPSPRVRRSAAQSLGWLQDSRAVPYLLPNLHDPDPDVVLATALAIQWIGDTRAIPGLMEVARTSQNSTTQQVVRGVLDDLSRRMPDGIELGGRANGKHVQSGAPPMPSSTAQSPALAAPQPLPQMPRTLISHANGGSLAPLTAHTADSIQPSEPLSPEQMWAQAAAEPTRRHQGLQYPDRGQGVAQGASYKGHWRRGFSMVGGGLLAMCGIGVSVWGASWISQGLILGIGIALVGVGLVVAGSGQIVRGPLVGAGMIIGGSGGMIVGGLYMALGWVRLGRAPDASGWGLAVMGAWLLMVGTGAVLYGIRRFSGRTPGSNGSG